MKKSLIKLGQKLYWDGKKDNVAVTVVDIPKLGNGVCIIDGNITHIVDAEHLSATPSNQPIPAIETPVAPVESVVQGEPVCTKPQLDFSYDEKTHSVFIVINEKTTICIPGLKKQTLDMIGVAYKHDEDNFNKEMGRALAFYRSEEGKQKVEERLAKSNPFPFPGFPFMM